MADLRALLASLGAAGAAASARVALRRSADEERAVAQLQARLAAAPPAAGDTAAPPVIGVAVGPPAIGGAGTTDVSAA